MNELFILNRRGLIPGPGESEERFYRRVARLLKPSSGKDLPREVIERTRRQYDMAPDWLRMHRNAKDLRPWHGGCSTICYDGEEEICGATIELSDGLLARTYFRWCAEEEIITHEVLHIGRMAFEEPVFEEALAYSSSSSPLRRLLGAGLDRYGTRLFATAVGGTVLLPLVAPPIIAPFFGVATAVLFLRHAKRKLALLQACLHSLQAVCGDGTAARHVQCRLTDDEIRRFAAMSSPQLKRWVDEASERELRWRLLRSAYFVE